MIQNGLNLDEAENVAGYPVPTYTYGIRNLTGTTNWDGSVTIFAITAQYSSISGGEPIRPDWLWLWISLRRNPWPRGSMRFSSTVS